MTVEIIRQFATSQRLRRTGPTDRMVSEIKNTVAKEAGPKRQSHLDVRRGSKKCFSVALFLTLLPTD